MHVFEVTKKNASQADNDQSKFSYVFLQAQKMCESHRRCKAT